jgi:hypothetical protein
MNSRRNGGIGEDPNLTTKHFVLVDSIDLSGATWSSAVIPCFSGGFDGNGFAIRGLNARGLDFLGLFGRIEAAGRIANVHMEGVEVIGTNAKGTVDDCRSTALVLGYSYVGGLVGVNLGSMTDCDGDAVATPSGVIVGGLAHACYAIAEVQGDGIVGGLVGFSAGGIRFSFAAGAPYGSGWVGGLAGRSDNRSVGEGDVIGRLL